MVLPETALPINSQDMTFAAGAPVLSPYEKKTPLRSRPNAAKLEKEVSAGSDSNLKSFVCADQSMVALSTMS
jgi:hypothetical protein